MSLLLYAVCGSAHSGKSEFIHSVLNDGFAEELTLYAAIDGAGSIEARDNVVMLTPDENDLIGSLKNAAVETGAGQAILECSEKFDLYSLRENCLAAGDIQLYQVIAVCEAAQFLADEGLQQDMADVFGVADMVVFNRCDAGCAASLRSKNIKLVAPYAQVYLEGENHDGEDYYDPDVFPFMGEFDHVDVKDEIFGTFYGDLFDNAPEYLGRQVTFGARLIPLEEGSYAAVRYFDCFGDVLTLGLCVRYNGNLQPEGWYHITGQVQIDECPLYEGEGPVIIAAKAVPADAPEQELIVF